jgi:single-strand DNA-binding protein
MNIAVIIGNLGADPELRHTKNGNAVCNFTVATTDRWKDKQGNQQEKTEWHKIVVWGKQAENCERYLSKGRKVSVRGSIQTRDWEDKDGNKRYTTEIVGQEVEFLGGGEGGGGGRGRERRSPPLAANFDQSFNDDDIPF